MWSGHAACTDAFLFAQLAAHMDWCTAGRLAQCARALAVLWRAHVRQHILPVVERQWTTLDWPATTYAHAAVRAGRHVVHGPRIVAAAQRLTSAVVVPDGDPLAVVRALRAACNDDDDCALVWRTVLWTAYGLRRRADDDGVCVPLVPITCESAWWYGVINGPWDGAVHADDGPDSDVYADPAACTARYLARRAVRWPPPSRPHTGPWGSGGFGRAAWRYTILPTTGPVADTVHRIAMSMTTRSQACWRRMEPGRVFVTREPWPALPRLSFAWSDETRGMRVHVVLGDAHVLVCWLAYRQVNCGWQVHWTPFALSVDNGPVPLRCRILAAMAADEGVSMPVWERGRGSKRRRLVRL